MTAVLRVFTIVIICLCSYSVCASVRDSISESKSREATKEFLLFERTIEKAKMYGQVYPDSALIWSEKAYQIAILNRELDWQVLALVLCSQYEFWNQEYNKSIVTAEKAKELMPLGIQNEQKLNLLFCLAEGYEYTGRAKLSSVTFESCYDMAEALSNEVMLSRLDIKMGNLSQVNGDVDRAFFYYKKALLRLDRMDGVNIGSYYTALHEYYDMIMKYPSLVSKSELTDICAKISIEERAFDEQIGMEHFQVLFADLKIRCLLASENLEELGNTALPSIKSLSAFSSNPTKFQQKLDLYTEVALRKSQIVKAIVYNDKSIELAQKSDNIALQIQAFMLKEEVALRQGQFRKAYGAQKKVILLSERLTELERRSAIDELETKLLTKEKEQRIKVLNTKQNLLEERSRYFIVSSVLFSVISFFAIMFFFRSKQKSVIIEQQSQAITIQNSQLELLNSTKDRIFSIIGHDLRKPVIAFRGISKKVNYLLRKKQYATLQAFGDEIEQSAHSLNQLTDNLLSWALSQKNVLPYMPELIKVDEVVEEVISIFKSVAAQKNIELSREINSTLMIYADVNGLKTVIRNLVDNAIKFTPEGGNVHITATATVDVICIVVTDTGVGMNEVQLESLFSTENAESQNGTNGEKGTGLGMHLVSELVKLNKGSISASSTPQIGTKFEIRFPQTS